MAPGLRKLKDRIDPSSVNGGVLLGLNGIVVKSHGGADMRGVASAVQMAADLARAPFRDEVAETVAAVMKRSSDLSSVLENEQDIPVAAQ
jgi:glycerol-3-phosphate acyltransferase PlsX